MLAGLTILRLGKHSLAERHRSTHPIAAAMSPVPAPARRIRALLIVGMTLAMMVYTVGFGQVEGSLSPWAQDRTDRMLCGFEIPASWFVGVMVGSWYVAGALGYWLSGELGAEFMK